MLKLVRESITVVAEIATVVALVVGILQLRAQSYEIKQKLDSIISSAEKPSDTLERFSQLSAKAFEHIRNMHEHPGVDPRVYIDNYKPELLGLVDKMSLLARRLDTFEQAKTAFLKACNDVQEAGAPESKKTSQTSYTESRVAVIDTFKSALSIPAEAK